jgi:acid phosphatase family membrane protein YuiD
MAGNCILTKRPDQEKLHPYDMSIKTNSIIALFQNPIFLSAVFSWFIAQFIKTLIAVIRGAAKKSLEVIASLMWVTGGMPSSHSAVVTSLATAIGFEVGLSDPLFIFAVIYGLLTLRDAVGVRRQAGLSARVLNELSRDLSTKFKFPERSVKETHGHTMTEVIVGALLGFFIAVAFCKL